MKTIVPSVVIFFSDFQKDVFVNDSLRTFPFIIGKVSVAANSARVSGA